MLKLNGDKIDVITFSPKWKITEPISVQSGNSSLTSTETVKNLGVWFDTTMSMETQVMVYVDLHTCNYAI